MLWLFHNGDDSIIIMMNTRMSSDRIPVVPSDPYYELGY